MTFIEEILKGDVSDKDYQKQIIDHLVSQVFVNDDNTVIYFNLRGGKDIETLTVDDTKNAVNNAKRVRTQLPLARQRRLGLSCTRKGLTKIVKPFFFCSRRFISIVLGERNDVAFRSIHLPPKGTVGRIPSLPSQTHFLPLDNKQSAHQFV